MQAALAIVYVVFLWWFATGVILYLDGLPARTYRWSILGATGFLAAGLLMLAATSGGASAASAYLAFTGAMMVWGWNELLFLTGMVTGPRRTACPRGAAGWPRARYASESIIYHELLLAASGLCIALVTSGGANRLGLATFAVLWIMRLSTKLNVFLGVPNLSEEFLPPHLKYLASYFARKPMNLLFPVSISLASLALVRVLDLALAAEADPFASVSATLIAVLMALAILEHWFLVLPLASGNLWKWGLRSHERTAPAVQPAAPNNPHTHNKFGLAACVLEGASAEPMGR